MGVSGPWQLLANGARHLAGPTTPPDGLYLVEVRY